VEPIPFLSLSFQHNQIQHQVQDAINQVYKRSWFILGDELKAFENAFSQYSGATFCIGVGNGLDALTLSLQSLGLQKEDEVIVPAHTYIATWLAISKTGARIIPIEPEINTFNIDVTKVEGAITSRTRVILPVHLYGQACDMTTIDQLARKHNIFIVEDNAQAHGAKWLEKFTGSFGEINATSFYPTKNLGALGDGGAVTTFDEQKAAFVRRHRNYGFQEKNMCIDQGSNSRLDEIQAAVLRIKLTYLDEWNSMRREIATSYLKNLQGAGDIILPLSAKEAFHVYHQFVIRTNYRDQLKTFLADHNIETLIHYPVPPHLQPSYFDLGFKKGDFPLTERIAETALSLPIWPGMESDQVDRITEVINKFYR